MKTLLDLFALFEKRNRTAFVYLTGFRRLSFSYRFMYEQSKKMASLLDKKGIKKGDRVAVWAPNSPWWAVCFWGIIIKGAVVVPVDFVSGKERAQTIIKRSGCKLLIQSQYKAEKIINTPSFLIEDLEFLLRDYRQISAYPQIKPTDLAELVFTSGTTGDPKGVMLTHKNLVANILQVEKRLFISSDYKVLSLLPLSHMFEQTGGFLVPIHKGAVIVYLRIIKPSAIMDALKKENISAMVVVPRLLQAIKNGIEKDLEMKKLNNILHGLLVMCRPMSKEIKKILFFPVSNKFGTGFKFFVSGGAALDKEIFEFWNDLGFVVLEGYGLTECSPVLSANSQDLQVPGSVGKALDGIAIQVDNGQILAKGDNVFCGYWENKKATNEVFTQDGFFKTGDRGELDSEKNIYIKGREKDIIITSAGIHVYPEEVERTVNKIQGVKESCVIGQDKGEGEQVHAVLLLERGKYNPEEIIKRANSVLDPQQQITGFTIWKDREFPKTTTLKIQKFKVKEAIDSDLSTNLSTTSDTLINLVAQVTGKSVKDIKEHSLLAVDLGLTSIARLELVNYVEQEFRIDLEDSFINQHTTVAALRTIIEKGEKTKGKTRLRHWVNTDFGRIVRQCLDAILHIPVFTMFFTVRTKGLENVISLKEPVIFIVNHRSFLDQSPVVFSLPPKIRYKIATAMREEFFFDEQHGFLNKLRKRLMFEYSTVGGNLFPLPQRSGFRRTLQYMGELIDQGINILIFPEGERSRSTKLLPFMPGIGIMVKELQVPILPVKVEGTEKIFPRGAKFLKKGVCTVSFGKPIYFTTETPNEIVQISRRALEVLE